MKARLTTGAPLFFVAAALCFFVALLIVTGIVASTREAAWEVGGFLALALGLLGV